MKKLSTTLLLGFTSLLSANAAQPANTKAATPLTVFYRSTAGVTCYDSNGNTLSYEPGNQSTTPLNTAYITSGTYLYPLYDDTKPATCDYDQYLTPFWTSGAVFNETVLLTGDSKTGKLLFNPKDGAASILSIKSFDGNTCFKLGTDISLNGRTLTQLTAGPSALYDKNKMLYKGLNYIQSSWVCVTYIPDRSNWKFPAFQKTSKLPLSSAKLAAKQELRVAAIGMSITAGQNVSGGIVDIDRIPAAAPYMRGYIEMMTMELEKLSGSKVTLFNVACPGKKAQWAADNADLLVNPCKPDLVIIDMGMNDIYYADENANFKTRIQSTMTTIKAKNPNVEFILIGNLLPDPSYNNWYSGGTPTKTGRQCMYDNQNGLKSLEATGVANLDMTTLSDTLYTRKSVKDCMTNELHPNDYMARWYAQGLVSLFYTIPDVTVPTGTICSGSDIAEINASTSDLINITPNPVVDGYLHIKVAENVDTQELVLTVYDVTGKQVASMKQDNKDKDYSLVNLNITNGIYLIKAQSGSRTSSHKVVVR
jgi:lysophospholipase L1-like esterase